MTNVCTTQICDNDICFQTPDKQRFRLRAAGIIIENGKILFAHNDIEPYYYSIGGGIKLGETAADACRREVLEETGIPYEIDRLAFIQENFFCRNDGMLQGLACHEIIFYFLMKSRGTQELNSHSYTQGIPEKMVWLSPSELAGVEAYPEFFRTELHDIPHTPKHIVTVQPLQI